MRSHLGFWKQGLRKAYRAQGEFSRAPSAGAEARWGLAESAKSGMVLPPARALPTALADVSISSPSYGNP